MSLPGKREFLSLHTNPATGEPFAVFPGRGRFSAEAEAFAAANSTLWAEVVKVERPKREAKPKAEATPKVDTSGLDIPAIRKWAEAEGLVEKGKRGRIPNIVIARYKALDGGVVAQRAKPVQAVPAQRENREGYVVERGKVLTFQHCGNNSCAMPIRFCKCADGPRAPKYLDAPVGGILLTLGAKPVV